MNVLIHAATVTATPSPNGSCVTYMAQPLSFGFLAVAFLVAAIVAYAMGWMAGREGLRKQLQKLFGNQPKGRR